MSGRPFRVLQGDMRRALRLMARLGIQADSCVTDPPYHLASIVKRFGKKGSAPQQFGSDGRYQRASRGFMGKQWDGGDIAFDPATWALVFDCLKPGAHLLAFGGTRGHHRMFCAIEDAGFEIRDTVSWLYGSGFPKSHNVGDGWGTALKPAWEPVCLARKPLSEKSVAANVSEHGTGAINIDGCRIGTSKRVPGSLSRTENNVYGKGLGGYRQNGSEGGHNPNLGRWPANVIHDGSEEVLAIFPQAAGQQRSVGPANDPKSSVNVYGDFGPRDQFDPRGDIGTAARFFYCAKADAADRLGSKHPTVKPVDLIAYLCRLVTPIGGLVLDPFAGTGTTGAACLREGLRAILIEREAEYAADIRRRLAHIGGTDTPLFADAAQAPMHAPTSDDEGAS